MNYRHSYHAGSFTDVFKHIVVISLIRSLLRKNKPFCYLETHAGIGCYNLFSETAQKTKEFEGGIKKVIEANQPPSLIQDYLSHVFKLNKPDELHFYPGSPYFVKQLLRTEDRMILSELHPEDAQTLKKFFLRDRQVAIHHQDGYQSLKAFLPPKERRGLVLIDPPYEKNNELLSLPALLNETLKRWQTGMYAIWYPIKTQQQNTLFHRELKSQIQQPFLTVELCIYSNDVDRLNGSGMIIINPPWQIDEELKYTLQWLWNVLSDDQNGYFSIF